MPDRLSPISAERLIRALERDGWYEVKSRGGHRHLKHSTKSGRVTVPVHGSQDLEPWLIGQILKQADLSVEAFLKLS